MLKLKHVFTAGVAFAAALYIIAELTLEHPREGEIVPLTWATDPNPARKRQTGGFAEMFPGFDIRVDPGLGGDQTKLIVRCATETGPDIIDVYGRTQMITLVEAGILLDLTPYADEMGFGTADTWKAIQPALSVDGKLYRYPCNIWANCIIYNRAVFDDHGVPYPKDDWTYEEFIRTCEKLRDTPSKSGAKHITLTNWQPGGMVQDMIIGLGGRFFSPDGLSSALDSPEAIGAMQLFHDMLFVREAFLTTGETNAMSSQGGWGSYGLNIFSVGKSAMISIGRWYIIAVPEFPGIKGKLAAVPLPRFNGRKSAGTCGTRAAGINAMGPRWKESLKFLQYLASAEYSKLIATDGDSLPPNPKYSRTGRDLVNDAVKDPSFHQTFLDAMASAIPIDYSPFIEPELVGRWYWERIGEVENRLATPEEAMRALASEINSRIRRNLERRPDLEAKYEKFTGRPYSRNWWKSHQVPGKSYRRPRGRRIHGGGKV